LLPDKDKIVLALDRAMEIAEKLPSSTEMQQPDKTPDESNTTKSLVTTRILVIF
jgi:hypothetical protein